MAAHAPACLQTHEAERLGLMPASLGVQAPFVIAPGEAAYFDLIMLDGGQLIYAGAVGSVQKYFEGLGFSRGDLSLPEWIVDLSFEARGAEGGGDLCAAFKSSEVWRAYEEACAKVARSASAPDGKRRSLAQLGGAVGRPNSLQALGTLTRFRMATHCARSSHAPPHATPQLIASSSPAHRQLIIG